MKRSPMVAAIAIVVIVAGCGQTSVASDGATSSAAAPSAGVTAPAASDDARQVELLHFNWFHEGGWAAHFDTAAADFVDLEPRVTAVNFETQPFARYHDVFNVKIGSGNPPDIAFIRMARRDAYIDAGHLVDLRPYIDAVPEFDIEDFGSLIDPYKRGDAIYGIPQVIPTWGVIFNRDLFAQAGLKTPDVLEAEGNWTYDTMFETAKALVDSGVAQYGFLHQGVPYALGFQTLAEYFASMGADPWSEDGKTCTMNSPEWVSALQKYHDMVFRDKAAPPPGDPINMASGQVGMLFGRPGFLFMLEDAEFEYGIVRGPDGTAGYVPEFGGYGLGAMANAPNPDLAAAYVVNANLKENLAVLNVNGNVSSRASGRTPEILREGNPNMTEEEVDKALVDVLATEPWIPEYSHKYFGEIFAQTKPIYDGKVWVEGADIQAAMEDACAAIAPIIAN